jgi:hypothetical protein
LTEHEIEQVGELIATIDTALAKQSQHGNT